MGEISNFLFVSTIVLSFFWLIGVLAGTGLVPGVVVLLTLVFLVLSASLNSEG